MSKNIFLMLLSISLMLSCNKDESQSFDSGIVSTRVDETAVINDDISTMVSKIEDSRCPTEVICVWEGQVKVFLYVETESSSTTLELIAPGFVPDETTDLDTAYFENFVIVLHSITPYPQTANPIPLEDYVVNLSVFTK